MTKLAKGTMISKILKHARKKAKIDPDSIFGPLMSILNKELQTLDDKSIEILYTNFSSMVLDPDLSRSHKLNYMMDVYESMAENDDDWAIRTFLEEMKLNLINSSYNEIVALYDTLQ